MSAGNSYSRTPTRHLEPGEAGEDEEWDFDPFHFQYIDMQHTHPEETSSEQFSWRGRIMCSLSNRETSTRVLGSTLGRGHVVRDRAGRGRGLYKTRHLLEIGLLMFPDRYYSSWSLLPKSSQDRPVPAARLSESHCGLRGR